MKLQCRSCAGLVFAFSVAVSSALDMSSNRHLHVREEPEEQPAPMSPEQEALLKSQPKPPTEVEDEDILFEKRLGLEYKTPDGETPVDVSIPAVWEREEEERLPFSVETMLAILFIGMIACVPFVLAAFESEKITRTQKVQSLALTIWLVSGIYIFTQVVQFSSGHFRPNEIRSLTLVEYIYLIAQIVTTVGYGDITPAYPRGQVFIGLYVLASILLIADMVTTMAAIVLERTKVYARLLARSAIERTEEVVQRARKSFSSSTEVEGTNQDDPPRHEISKKIGEKDSKWLDVSPPHVAWTQLAGAFVAFAFFNVAGILFYHYHPGEGKTWMEAIYMSIITLSTVGFGAITATTEMGKAFGAFWMLFGVGALGGVVTAFTTVMLQLKEKERWNPKRTSEEFKKLSESFGFGAAAGDLEKPPKRVDALHFLKFGLAHSNSVTQEDIERIQKSFMGLKPTNGKVNVAEACKMWCQ